jgi:energy-converting hydrogenase Eha subunit A
MTLHSIFLDESGKPEVYNFAGNKNLVELGNASKFLVLCAISTADQLEVQRQVNGFRLSLLEEERLAKIFTSTYSLSDFHAYKDYPIIKAEFLQFITQLPNLQIDVIVADKLKLPQILKQNPNRMYGTIAGILLKGLIKSGTEVIFSRKDTKLRLQKEIEIVESERLKLGLIHTNIKYFHNPHHTHGALQIADYIAYAVFQKYENQKLDLFKIIENKINLITVIP